MTDQTRRAVLATSAAFAFATSATAQTPEAQETSAIRPFRADIPQDAIDDLRRRIAMTRWPEAETVRDRAQGVQLAHFQTFVRYWGAEYDWRRGEAELNRYP